MKFVKIHFDFQLPDLFLKTLQLMTHNITTILYILTIVYARRLADAQGRYLPY